MTARPQTRGVDGAGERKPFVWRGSQLSLDIVAHEEEDGELTPSLQVYFRVRVPLNGNSLAEQREHAVSILEPLKEGLLDLPCVEGRIKTWHGEALRERKYRGRMARPGTGTELEERE